MLIEAKAKHSGVYESIRRSSFCIEAGDLGEIFTRSIRLSAAQQEHYLQAKFIPASKRWKLLQKSSLCSVVCVLF